MDAFGKLSHQLGNRRFAVLIDTLKLAGAPELKSTVLTLINAMINAVAELEARSAVRREFVEQHIIEEIGVHCLTTTSPAHRCESPCGHRL